MESFLAKDQAKKRRRVGFVQWTESFILSPNSKYPNMAYLQNNGVNGFALLLCMKAKQKFYNISIHFFRFGIWKEKQVESVGDFPYNRIFLIFTFLYHRIEEVMCC